MMSPQKSKIYDLSLKEDNTKFLNALRNKSKKYIQSTISFEWNCDE